MNLKKIAILTLVVLLPLSMEAQKNKKGVPSYTQFPSVLSPPAAAGPAQLTARSPCSCIPGDLGTQSNASVSGSCHSSGCHSASRADPARTQAQQVRESFLTPSPALVVVLIPVYPFLVLLYDVS